MEDGVQEHADRFAASLTEDGRYRLLVEAVTDYAIYMLDITGHVTSWNAGAQRFKGYTRAEIIGQHFSRFYTEEDLKTGRPAKALATATAEGRFEGEGWRVRKDGSRFWASVVIDAIRDPEGHVVAFAKITRDLTERRLSEEALRRSEEQFKHLVQGVTDYSIYLLEPNGTIGSWNAGAQRIKGYLPAEILGQHFSRFYTEEDRKNGLPARALATATAEGKFEGEGWRVRKDGTTFWASVVIDRLHDGNGEHIGFAKITRDITERRETQLALDKAREALFQSQKMEALGQLTGGIAHDFNNLLAAVLGSLEIARKQVAPDSRAARLMENAHLAAQRGISLTRRMLAFARRQDLNLEAIDLPALLRGMSDLLERSIGPSIVVEMHFPPHLPRSTGDANQLEMALLNLAVNGRDAMPDGGTLAIAARTVTVAENHEKLRPGGYVCLSVRDSGFGMDEATLARATDPFFTTKGVGKGTGLGLSMVYGLAEQSGGQFVLKSQPGVGTTAEIWLPAAPAVGSAATASVEGTTGSSAPLTILVVDDDNLVLTNMTAMLEDLGHTVHEANSGRQALEVLRRGTRIDLVITDQAMPRMTGMQLIAEIKTEWPDLPIVLATGYAELPPDAVHIPRTRQAISAIRSRGSRQERFNTPDRAPGGQASRTLVPRVSDSNGFRQGNRIWRMPAGSGSGGSPLWPRSPCGSLQV
ncbi:MAG TPA: PAS domain S-box protein [Acetobacteraceae bacterium]|jgi:PAS domain S-box-containing protein